MSRRYRTVSPATGARALARRLRAAITGKPTMAVRDVPMTAGSPYRPLAGAGGSNTPDRAKDAWALYRSSTVPELGYLVARLSSALSRCAAVKSKGERAGGCGAAGSCQLPRRGSSSS